MVGLVFGEGDGEVLDAVRHAEFFEEQDELTQIFNELTFIFRIRADARGAYC